MKFCSCRDAELTLRSRSTQPACSLTGSRLMTTRIVFSAWFFARTEPSWSGLRVAQEAGVIDRVEDERRVTLQGGLARRMWLRLVMSGTSECGSVAARAGGFRTSRCRDTLRLGLAGCGLGGRVLAELVGGSVDAVVSGEGGGEDEALHEGGAAAILQGDLCRISGVFGQKLGWKKSDTGRLRDLFEVGLQLERGGAPGEVGIGLSEAGLGERVHDVGAGEGFGEEDDVGMLFAQTVAMHHSQKGSALVCGLSTRKTLTPRLIQNSKTDFSSSQSARQSEDSKLRG